MEPRFEFAVSPERFPINTRLTLPAAWVSIRKNGIEFRSASAITLWTEMTIGLESCGDRRLECDGVVVACRGSRQNGYLVSLLFTSLSRQSQAALNSLGVR